MSSLGQEPTFKAVQQIFYGVVLTFCMHVSIVSRAKEAE